MPDVVLLTGVSRHLGGVFARLLSADPSIGRIIGVDVVPPPHPLGRAEFIRADIRSPMISKVITGADVDTIVHMSVIATPMHVGGRSTQKEINVIGSMQLLAACQRAPSVRKLVVKSTAGVYGSSYRDPAMFREDMAAKRLPASGFGKDSVEVEGYVRGFARRRPDVEISMLRFANVIGPRVRTAMTDYFTLPLVPLPLGYGARLQFVHEDDVAGALAAATRAPAVGTVNVAGSGVITIGQAVALTGRAFLAVPPGTVHAMSAAYRRAGLIDFSPDQLDFLIHGRGLDLAAMDTRLGFTPKFTTRAAFEDFVRGAGTRPIDRAQERLLDLGAAADRMVRAATTRIPRRAGLTSAGALR
ncbi:MAG: NAD-dependent epimerase/dehydratase family protein [Tetrasphaera jenkinsii]|jgi:UDP-glucose 4-epimerase|uniref:NAD-dependent epimerase/dehydratase domain-containing protein n=1 Tax=Nostocoides jenkinsii Ben 74 TaxID=1193518 RepID=A0A077ME72_9MICO|nr:NAD-dependent epimerase/dehydratase family protein [Tetrasphaera jenkinsii]MCI1261039.1 NAD-dependent epimerase/dehydratase family protein [Tetrasphaera jenkinsii]CCI54260.1 conserved hypothetical protein [Tetrasphaera jenkinsii Ben 74]